MDYDKLITQMVLLSTWKNRLIVSAIYPLLICRKEHRQKYSPKLEEYQTLL